MLTQVLSNYLSRRIFGEQYFKLQRLQFFPKHLHGKKKRKHMKINLTWYSDLQGKNPTQFPLIKCMSSVASVVFCASSIWEALHSRYSWFRLVPVGRLCISFASLHWLFPSSGLRIYVRSSFIKNDLELLFLILPQTSHKHPTAFTFFTWKIRVSCSCRAFIWRHSRS